MIHPEENKTQYMCVINIDDDVGLKDVATVLQTNALALKRARLGNNYTQTIAVELTVNHTVTSLIIGYNNIDTIGVQP